MSDMQNHSNASPKSDWVEVWFKIDKDADGYPESKSWEGLWTSPVDGGFQIQSVPFYLKNVSRWDVVSAEQSDFLRFTSVSKHTGHNTYRLLMADATSLQIQEAVRELEQKGLTVEINEAGILLAVDVPNSLAQRSIDDFLISQKNDGRWEMQDGLLNGL